MVNFFYELGHGGDLIRLGQRANLRPSELVDFSTNLNPLGPPRWLPSFLAAKLDAIIRYPDPDCAKLVQAIADRFDVRPDQVLVGNGSTELLYTAVRALKKTRALIPAPSYIDYGRAAAAVNLAVDYLPLAEKRGFALDLDALAEAIDPHTVVFIGHPANPTGLLCDSEQLRQVMKRHPQTAFVIDEAFIDFTTGQQSFRQQRPANAVVLYSLTKTFAIAGLRLGCAFAAPSMIDALRRITPPWSVNGLAQLVGIRALADTDYLERTRQFTKEQRSELAQGIGAIPGFEVFEGQANYLLVKCTAGFTAGKLADRLLARGLAVRLCDNYEGLDNRFFRVAVRTPAENEHLVTGLRRAADTTTAPLNKRAKKKPAIMIQGVSSNAGKSVLVAALCRILHQDGIRVAPFKAQNMSLNSHVTRNGEEMGRAQALQARACRVPADVRMNPILLKPHTDKGSQVIVNGKPIATVPFDQYADQHAEMKRITRRAYDSLSSEFDVVVIEGAGSPAEFNLRSRDLVNMETARYAEATVLLVGDIDRGGVFASFLGTMALLAPWEQQLVRGFVINRFRGQRRFLTDAIDPFASLAGRPILGVIPYIRDLGLPEEDSVGFKTDGFGDRRIDGEAVDIAVIDLPHVSNFTDFDPLREEPDVRLRTMRTPDQLGHPDAVVIPGSKNTMADLRHLCDIGWKEALRQLADKTDAWIVGICAGFQMLGTAVTDPTGLESARETEQPGLGLLPVRTRMHPDKTLIRSQGVHLPSQHPVEGYEIHHGLTDQIDAQPAFVREDGAVVGVSSTDGQILGTYLHGVFDRDQFRRWFIDALRRRRGLAPLDRVVARYDLEPPLDRLAQVVREALDMAAIYRALGVQ